MRPWILMVPTSYCPLYVHHLTYLLNSQMKPVQQSPPFVTEDAESRGFGAQALSLPACTADRQPPDCARARAKHARPGSWPGFRLRLRVHTDSVNPGMEVILKGHLIHSPCLRKLKMRSYLNSLPLQKKGQLPSLSYSWI